MVSFSPAVEEQTVAPALKRLLCWLLKKGRGLVSGRPMEVQGKPADSASIVPCLEAWLRGYTEALCCTGLPSLSRFLLQAAACASFST